MGVQTGRGGVFRKGGPRVWQPRPLFACGRAGAGRLVALCAHSGRLAARAARSSGTTRNASGQRDGAQAQGTC